MKPRQFFRFDDQGNIVSDGGGVVFHRSMHVAHGVVALDLDMLNKLYNLGMLEGQISRTDADVAMDDARRRIEDAKQDLITDLGLDPSLTSPRDHWPGCAAHGGAECNMGPDCGT